MAGNSTNTGIITCLLVSSTEDCDERKFTLGTMQRICEANTRASSNGSGCMNDNSAAWFYLYGARLDRGEVPAHRVVK